MSHFNFENDINNLLRMDAPLSRGPEMRWQRKLNESSNNACNDSALNVSANQSMSGKTPMKVLNRSALSNKTPAKTPNKTPGSVTKTPGKTKGTPGRGNKTPQAADRFIPNRSATNFDLSHHLLTAQVGRSENEEAMSPSQRDFQQSMSDNLNGDALNSKVLTYKNKPPAAPEGSQNGLRVLYQHSSKTPCSVRKTTRHIPQVPERILDAPDILDDYYLNLLDWSVNNHLAVALGGSIYLWNASTGDISPLLEMENSDEYVSSVAWINEGNILAVGTSNAEVQLWDVGAQKRLRSMTGHVARVGALSWNQYILSSGCRSGSIYHHDVRAADHLVSRVAAHTQEVCGLKWAPDGRFLASGGNDNTLQVWKTLEGLCYSDSTPLHTFTDHQAAVKALAWCPWRPSLLASGGGTADRHIRFWNVNTGSCENVIDAKSQVTSLLWSPGEFKELISSHGFAQNEGKLVIWKYPSLSKTAELTGHTGRVLQMVLSPDGSTVVSAAADETLRLWKCFALDPTKKKSAVKSKTQASGSLTMRQNIR